MGAVPVGVAGVRVAGGVTESSSASLVLDDGGVGRGAPEAKTAMALKNHSEAERRRRERINSHLATLRTMVPCSDKVDPSSSSSSSSPFYMF